MRDVRIVDGKVVTADGYGRSRAQKGARGAALRSAPDDFEPHDFYGPCDGFGRGGVCSVCRDLLYTLSTTGAAAAFNIDAVREAETECHAEERDA